MDIINSQQSIYTLQNCIAKEVRDMALDMQRVSSELVLLDEKLKVVRDRVQAIVKKSGKELGDELHKELLALESYILEKKVNK